MDSDPVMSVLLESAVKTHEMFQTLVRAGFTEDQALKLIAYTLVGGISG